MPPIGGWKTGVYQIRNLVNGKVYVGSGASKRGINGRFWDHRNDLNANSHHSIKLQRAWIKYGSESFVFEVIELTSPANCISREQWWMDKKDSCKNGYNILPTAGSPLGSKQSIATRHLKSTLLKEVFKEGGQARVNLKKTVSARFQTEEGKQHQRNAAAKAWSNPEKMRERILLGKGTEQAKINQQRAQQRERSPEEIAMMSTRAKQKHEDPEWKSRWLAAVKSPESSTIKRNSQLLRHERDRQRLANLAPYVPLQPRRLF